MSKGNPFLSQMRGKLGDVVFYRQDGEQITRSRNRHPRNPKTEPQLYQRAVMATITAAYKAGKSLFDHSFEGFSVGAANQREFIKRNARLLRSTMAADIDGAAAPDAQLGRVVGPGTDTPVGFEGMIISNGTYPQSAFEFSPTPDQDARGYLFKMPAAETNETCAEYAERIGLIAGDFYTICGIAYNVYDSSEVFIVTDADPDDGNTQYRGIFFFIRLGVKSDFISSTDAVAAKTFGDIFYADSYGPDVDVDTFLGRVFSRTLDIGDVLRENTWGPWDGYVGVIRSRKDVDLRSASVLHCSETQVVDGIISSLALQAWQQGTSALGNSRLILEGGGFSRRGSVTPSPTPAELLEGVYYAPGGSSQVQWPISGNTDITTGMSVKVAKTAYPDKTAIGLVHTGGTPSYSWTDSGDYWTQDVMLAPGNTAVYNIVINGSEVGGSVTMTIS